MKNFEVVALFKNNRTLTMSEHDDLNGAIKNKSLFEKTKNDIFDEVNGEFAIFKRDGHLFTLTKVNLENDI